MHVRVANRMGCIDVIKLRYIKKQKRITLLNVYYDIYVDTWVSVMSFDTDIDDI